MEERELITWWCRACKTRSVCTHQSKAGAYQAIYDIRDSHDRVSPQCNTLVESSRGLGGGLGFVGGAATPEEVEEIKREFRFLPDPQHPDASPDELPH